MSCIIELTELDAWLYFLSSDDPRDILRITEEYPMFRQFYQEIIQFRYHPYELITMYSDTLQIMDRNTARYMIDEMKDKIKQLDNEYSQLCVKNSQLSEKNSQLNEKYSQLSEQNSQLSEKNSQLSAENQRLHEELERLKNKNNTK